MRKIAVLYLSLLLIACNKGADPVAPNTGPVAPTEIRGVWPIVKGNYWVYTDSMYNKGVYFANFFEDSLHTRDSLIYENKIYYGTMFTLPYIFFSQVDDNTVEQYNTVSGRSSIFFKKVFTNDTLIWKTEQDAMIPVNGTEKNVHIVSTHKGYTDLTMVNGYECIRNEFVSTYDGVLHNKSVIYVKPGLGMVKLVQYRAIDVTGPVVIEDSRSLSAYKFR